MDQDYEILVVTLENEQDILRFFQKHFDLHAGSSHLTVRIVGPGNNWLRDSEILKHRAQREMLQAAQETVTLSCRNLPPTSPYEINRYGYSRTRSLELRLHTQRTGEPGVMDVIEQQDRLDWAEARRLCLAQGQAVHREIPAWALPCALEAGTE